MARAEPKVEKDCCVICGRPTEYLKSQNIYERNYYVEGAGQLCDKCYSEIY